MARRVAELLPPLTGRTIALASVAWVGLLALAAWLGTIDGVLFSVASSVVGSAAGVAFAATGLVALWTRWQRRQVYDVVTPIAVSHINDVNVLLERLVRELLDPVWPSLPTAMREVLDIDTVVVLLLPPTDPSRAKDVISTLAHGMRSTWNPDLAEATAQRRREPSQFRDIIDDGLARIDALQTDDAHRRWLRSVVELSEVVTFETITATDARRAEGELDEKRGAVSAAADGLYEGIADAVIAETPGSASLGLAAESFRSAVRSLVRSAKMSESSRDGLRQVATVLETLPPLASAISTVRAELADVMESESARFMLERYALSREDERVSALRMSVLRTFHDRIDRAWTAVRSV